MTVYCPPIKTYPQAFSDDLASELDQVSTTSPIYTAIEDYSDLRDLIRACEKAK